MLGLERAYYELDSVRSRIVRLVEMNRLAQPIGRKFIDKVISLQTDINKIVEAEDLSDEGGTNGG